MQKKYNSRHPPVFLQHFILVAKNHLGLETYLRKKQQARGLSLSYCQLKESLIDPQLLPQLNQLS